MIAGTDRLLSGFGRRLATATATATATAAATTAAAATHRLRQVPPR